MKGQMKCHMTKGQMKCHMKRYFIRVYTVAVNQKQSSDKEIQFYLEIITFDSSIHTMEWIIPSVLYHTGLKAYLSVQIEIISRLTDKGHFQYLTGLKGTKEETYLYKTKFISLT